MTEKLYIGEAEWYPVYVVEDHEGQHDETYWYGPLPCELPDGFAARFDTLMLEFRALQHIMREAHDAAEAALSPPKPSPLMGMRQIDLSDIDPELTQHLKHGDVIVQDDGLPTRIILNNDPLPKEGNP